MCMEKQIKVSAAVQSTLLTNYFSLLESLDDDSTYATSDINACVPTR